MQRETIIERYERSRLHGTRMTLSGSSKEKESDALTLIRYIVDEILGWEPQEAVEHMTREVAVATGIDQLMENYIVCPVDINKEEDFGYAVHKAFQAETRFNVEEKLMAVYKDLEQGRRSKFPKKFFDGEYGRYRASYLLLYIIGANIPLQKNDVKGLYDLFANTAEINKLLHEWKIYTVCRKLYSSPLEYLHESLPEDVMSDFYFNYHSFMHTFNEYEKKYRKDVWKEMAKETEAVLA